VQHLGHRPGLGRLEGEPVEHQHLARLRLRAQRAAQRQPPLLAGHVLVVGAGGGTEDDAATPELRGADRALTGTPGPLLPVGLAATAAHLPPVAGVVGALPGVGELAEQRLVHHRLVHRAVEDLRAELVAAGAQPALVDDGGAGHHIVA